MKSIPTKVRGHTEYIPTFKKPKPTIEKIKLTDEQKYDIDAILNGKPTLRLLNIGKVVYKAQTLKRKLNIFARPLRKKESFLTVVIMELVNVISAGLLHLTN